MIWNHGLTDILEWSSQYFSESQELDPVLLRKWHVLNQESMIEWERVIRMPSLIAEGAQEDEFEVVDVEENLFEDPF